MDNPTYSLWRVNATALLVDPRIPGTLRQDVFDSVLYAQLQTDKREGSPGLDYPAWSGRYRDALASRGWAARLREGQYLPDEPPPAGRAWRRLADQLLLQCPAAAPLLDAAVALLEVQFAQPGAVLELGLLQPGPQLLLCGLGAQRQAAEPGVQAEVRQAYLSTWCGVLDEDSYDEMRAAVRRAIAGKQHAHSLVEALGSVAQGGQHGPA